MAPLPVYIFAVVAPSTSEAAFRLAFSAPSSFMIALAVVSFRATSTEPATLPVPTLRP